MIFKIGDPVLAGADAARRRTELSLGGCGAQFVGAFQAGLGTYGGPVVQNNFPFTSPTQMLPANQTHVYRWIPYNKIGSAPTQVNDNGPGPA